MSRDKKHRTTGLVTVALVAIGLTSGCGAVDFLPLVEATATVSEKFTTGDTPVINVDAFNGPIDVSDDATGEVIVEVTKHARGLDHEAAAANLNQIEVTVAKNENTIQVVARGRAGAIGNMGAAVVIAAPKGAKLQLRSSNGHIVCEGMQGGMKAVTSNGRIEAVAAAGAINAKSSNGSIDIEATNATIDAHTSNGSVRFKGSLAPDEQKLSSSNGSIKLDLPPESQFRFDCSTSNARVSCDFAHSADSNRRGTHVKGSVGDKPMASIAASTSNGSIQIRKASIDQD